MVFGSSSMLGFFGMVVGVFQIRGSGLGYRFLQLRHVFSFLIVLIVLWFRLFLTFSFLGFVFFGFGF